MRDVSLYIKDILDAIRDIHEFVGDMEIDEFMDDKKTSMAVIREFEIIGEATKAVPEDIRILYPDIPWKQMAGMRDRLIHAYFDIDYSLVWSTIKNTLPKLAPKLQSVMDSLFS